MTTPQDLQKQNDRNGNRWAKRLAITPGHWKGQLPVKLLRLAADGKLTQLQQVLASEQTTVNARGSHGRTLLFEAIRNNRLNTVHWLLENGANPALTGCYFSESFVQLDALATAWFYKRHHMETLLKQFSVPSDLFRVTLCGDFAELNRRLLANPKLISAEDPQDLLHHSPLISFAVVGRHFSMAKFLIEEGAQVVQYSKQLLFIAAHFSHTELLELLLESGASPTSSDALLWMSTDRLEILQSLVQAGLSANATPYKGLTPLMYSCRGDKFRSLPKVRFLLQLGAEVNRIGPNGRTALHFAARTKNLPLCQLLLDFGAREDCRDDQNLTAYDLAIKLKCSELAQLLQSSA